MRLHRPIGILLLAWPMLWTLWIAAGGLPDMQVLLVFVLGAILMRSAGCVINDYADRNIDGHVRRTRDRPLAQGSVAPGEALVLFAGLLLLAALLVLLTNRLTILLAIAGAGLAVIYPFTKRHTHLPQLFLGAAFGWAVPMAWAAQTGSVAVTAWLLFISAVLWAVIYDTQYAMVDRDDDLVIGVKSTAILFGDADRLIIGVLQITFICSLLLIGLNVNLGWPYYCGVGAAAATAGHQQYLIRYRDRDGCFRAFLNNNLTGAAVFAGIVFNYLLTT